MGKLFSGFFAIAAIVLAIGILYEFRVSNRMIATTGEIKNIQFRLGFDSDSTRRSGRSYIVTVNYDYSVSGNILQGQRLRFDGNSYILRKNAEVVVEKLSRNNNVTVWYDPLRPSLAILLKPETPIRAIIGFIVCILLSFMSYRYLDKTILYLLDKFKK